MMLKTEYAFFSEIGKKRIINQDYVLINERENIYVVADGMGGHSAGEVASQLACNIVEEYIIKHKREKNSNIQLVSEAVKEANKIIWEKGFQEIENRNMGTTITLLMFGLSSYYIASVGDSRAYLVRKEKISQITEDHSYVNELFKKGLITQKEREYSFFKNILTRAVGTDIEVEIDTFKGKIYKNDYFLLSSDGFHNEIEDRKLLEIILKNNKPETICNNLHSYANQREGLDDKSLVVIYIQEK